MPKYGHTDANHNEIVHALEQVGAKVHNLAAVGQGCPDILVIYRGKVYIFEIKTAKGKLKQSQEKWWEEAEYAGLNREDHIVRTIEEALQKIGAI